MLVLQAMHGLSMARTECLVADGLSWMRFCGLGPGDAVPDANTLWDFREALIAVGALGALFTRLDATITVAGCQHGRMRNQTGSCDPQGGAIRRQ
jgi:IS5 family transposase